MDIKAFRGLNNVTDPLRLGPGWLSVANNIVVTDTGAVERREGYSLVSAGNFSGAYSTRDSRRAYLISAGTLRTFGGAVLKTGITDAQMYWAEVDDLVFYNNGVDSGVILPDESVIDWAWSMPVAPSVAAVTGDLPAGMYRVCCTSVLPDGRETGASDYAEILLSGGRALQITGLVAGARVYIAPANSAVFQLAFTAVSSAAVWDDTPDYLGRELNGAEFDPLPAGGGVIQAWRGRMYVAQYLPQHNQTVVWFSEPMGYHLFNLRSNFFMVSGRVTMLAPHSEALVVGTDTQVFAYTGTNLKQVIDYGVVPGQHWDRDDDRILFWTTRGVCTFPVSNLTERQVSVAPGVYAGGTIVRSGGQKRFVVALHQGDAAFNSRSQP